MTGSPGSPNPTAQKHMRQAAELIRSAQRGAALTGAGFSTPSGIPDFRSTSGGLWQRYDPFEVASLSAFRRNPERVFAWLRPLANDILSAAPNPAHDALAQLAEAGHFSTVITQNIDGLHQKGGFENVVEIHGSLDTCTCTHCFRIYPSEDFIAPYVEDGIIPTCPECGHILKPDVILFDEQLPHEEWRRAEQAMETCDLLLVAGSSLVVMPVAGLPQRALNRSVPVIVVNKSSTYLDVRADVVIPGDVAEILPRIAQEVLRA